MKMFDKKNRGQMLIEVVVALGIIGLVLVGVSDLMTRSTRVISFQKQKDEALNISQKILTQYRVQRDSDSLGFYNTVASTVMDPCVSGKPYVCNVTIVKSATEVLVSVKVDWSDGGQTFNVSLSESLSKDIK